MTTRSNVKYCSPACRHEGRAKIVKKLYDPEKERKYQQRYRQRNNMAVRQSRYKTWYGITLAEFDAIFSKQEGKCAICGCALKPYGRETHLDHKHDASTKIRGILCRNCNSGLGYFRDSPALIMQAIFYLRQFQTIPEVS
jgi:hypothetical protein